MKGSDLFTLSKKRRRPKCRGGKSSVVVPVYRCQLVQSGTLVLEQAQARSAAAGARLVARFLADADREHLVVVALSNAKTVLGVSTVSVGTHKGVPSDALNLLKMPILVNADELIVAHNHTCGDPTTSRGDHRFTRWAKRVCGVVGIPLADHIVIGRGDRYFSYFSSGKL